MKTALICQSMIFSQLLVIARVERTIYRVITRITYYILSLQNYITITINIVILYWKYFHYFLYHYT